MGQNYHEIVLCDPDDRGTLIRVAEVGFLLSRPYHKLRNPDAQLAREIIRIFEPDERAEFLGSKHYPYVYRCCAGCGSALGMHECNGCGRAFHNDPLHSPTGVNLPPQLRAWFEAHGHKFER